MADPKKPKLDAEDSGNQQSNIGLLGYGYGGFGGYGLGSFLGGSLGDYVGSYGASSIGGSAGGIYPYGIGQPGAALVGAGTFEGTNKYSGGGWGLGRGGAVSTGGDGVPSISVPALDFALCDIMMCHPTIVLAAITVMVPVLAAERTVEATEGAPKGAKEAVEKHVLPKIGRAVFECLRGLVYGNKSFEKVWELKDGLYTYKKIKPLLPELTGLNVDAKTGEFSGVKSYAQGATGELIPPTRSMVFTWDQHGSDVRGRPILKNCVRTHSNWLNCEDNLARLGAKVSSIIPVVKYPGGDDIDLNGNKVSAYNTAVAVAQGMASGRPVVVQNLAKAQIEDLRMVGDLAKASLWEIDTINMGEAGSSINALLAQLQYYDKLLVRAWCQPERSMLEAITGGSRADSQSHGDIGTSVCDFIHGLIVECLSASLIDDFMRVNYGPETVGKVWLKAQAIADELKAFFADLVKAMCGPKTINEFLKRINIDGLLSYVKLPREEGTDGPWEPEPEQPPAPSQPAKMNGNGRMAKAASGKDEN